jgi:hypothetical protein
MCVTLFGMMAGVAVSSCSDDSLRLGDGFGYILMNSCGLRDWMRLGGALKIVTCIFFLVFFWVVRKFEIVMFKKKKRNGFFDNE